MARQRSDDTIDVLLQKVGDVRIEMRQRGDQTAAELMRIEGLTREVAVGGLWWEVVGLSLVALGTVAGSFS